MDIIYAVCSWGLGHATRSLPIIRKLINENNNLTIISSGRSLELLKKEISDDATYFDIQDYPMLLSENSRQFLAKSAIYWPIFIKRIESGLIRLSKIIEKKRYDLIISDARYDMYSKKIPSVFISHQIRIMNPLRIKMFETGSELFNKFFFKRFSKIIVPDFKNNNLSGDLSHNLKKIDEEKIYYIGILSDFKKIHIKKDIDYLFSVSGPEPQRTIFENKIYEQISDIKGKIVITQGKTESKINFKNKNVQTYSFLNKEEREILLNRAKLVISRSGYSTLMDLAVIGLKALFIPTPGQIEQEYLGEYHNELRTFYSVAQTKLNLISDLKIAQKNTGIKRKCDPEKTVEKFLEIIY